MGTAHTIYSAWKTAKGVGLCFVLGFAGGCLTRELFYGKIDPANKAAAYILDLTLLVMLAALMIVGGQKVERQPTYTSG